MASNAQNGNLRVAIRCMVGRWEARAEGVQRLGSEPTRCVGKKQAGRCGVEVGYVRGGKGQVWWWCVAWYVWGRQVWGQRGWG